MTITQTHLRLLEECAQFLEDAKSFAQASSELTKEFAEDIKSREELLNELFSIVFTYIKDDAQEKYLLSVANDETKSQGYRRFARAKLKGVFGYDYDDPDYHSQKEVRGAQKEDNETFK